MLALILLFAPVVHFAVTDPDHRRPPIIATGYKTAVRVREVASAAQVPMIGKSGAILGRVATLPGSYYSVIAETYDKDLGLFFILGTAGTFENFYEMTPQGMATELTQFGNSSVPSIVYSTHTKKLYYSDDANYRIVQVDPVSGQMIVLAGGCHGTNDGKGSAACFQQPQGIDADPTTGTLYVADYDRVRQVTIDGTVTTLTAPSSIGPYFQFGQGDEGVAFDTNLRQLYVADPANQLIHAVSLTGNVTTLTGQCCGQYQRDGSLQSALFAAPTGLYYNPKDKSLYVADSNNNQIRKVQNGVVSTLAGNGQRADANGVGATPSFAMPVSVAFDPGNSGLYVGEARSSFVRTVSTIGSAPPPPPHGTTLYDPTSIGSAPAGIAVKPDGSVWFTESGTAKIGELTTGKAFVEFALPTGFSNPTSVAIGSDGNVWFADQTGVFPNQTASLGRLDMSGTVKEYALTGGPVQRLTLGQDGNIWFALGGSGLGGGFGDITPAGVIQQFNAATPFAIAFGYDNAIWLLSGATNVSRYSVDGAFLSYTQYPGAANPVTLHRGKNSRMWMAESDALAELNGQLLIEYQLPAPCQYCGSRGLQDFEVDASGFFWLAEAIGYIGRFTTNGTVADYIIAAPRSRPASIALASDGTVWFADPGADRIGRWY